jgi:serine/threonine protein kinase
VAIKCLHSAEEKEFKKETTILNALGSKPKPHPHLIKLLATYRLKQKYHLMFPYADANLRTYWDDRKTPSFDRATVLWSLRQMTGIANALLLIHNFSVTIPLDIDGPGQVRVQNDVELRVRKGEELYGRHGDLKPENILWFKESAEINDENGILQIADFGLGRFHGRDSRSKDDPYTVQSSPTYEPPECKLRRPVSRAYDMWSLGCLYLEFITWLLMGSAEIEGFSEFRGKLATSTGIDDDNFFTIITGPVGARDAVVREQVVDWVRKLHEHEKCSNLIHNLLELIMERLLVVDSKERINATLLNLQMKMFLDKAEDDSLYLLDPAPWS